ncbi:hypothetical protein G7Y41_04820 [Schaalia sp. ZJ405]|uniref:hypothetical protein n=1 Tax=Schaalia sp. ZJ405 TaxID=2709403 RepID=UPI0013E9C808|nr:hypothetical protein [Schaalia sp. ZJ405]QPK80451.1 hypothetical protein G7Y41_04820 [Schaalia sp. ZJ405]
MKKILVPLSALALAAATTLIAYPTFARSHGCRSYSAQDGHAVGSFCPYSAPYTKHQGFGTMYINSGYTTKAQTQQMTMGLHVQSDYYYGGHLTSHWQKLY